MKSIEEIHFGSINPCPHSKEDIECEIYELGQEIHTLAIQIQEIKRKELDVDTTDLINEHNSKLEMLLLLSSQLEGA